MEEIAKVLLVLFLIPHLSFGDNLALLSGTLRSYQKASCDEEWVNLQCPEATTISVQFAQYGKIGAGNSLCKYPTDLEHHHASTSTATNNLTCLSHSAIQTITSICQKKQNCRFQATPRTFGGDPCPYARKFVEVAYKCRPSQFKSVIGCENDVVHLSCAEGSRLAIYSASFGRTSYESVQCPQPYRVQEETCLASYATETVMQICHGKRRCAIDAEAATFGRPCKPESRMYLKTIYTCVPRKVLKEKYQGELESDEIEDEDDDETDDRANDSTSRIIEQPSIPSSNYPSGSEKTLEPFSSQESQGVLKAKSGMEKDNFARSSAVLNSEPDINRLENNSSHPSTESAHDIHFIHLISQSMNAYDYISRNAHTFWLLVAISMMSVFLLLLFLLLIRLVYLRHKGKKAKEEQKKKSSTIRRASGLSDIDELSLVMDPSEYIHLPTIQRRSNPSSSNSGLVKNTVVRYSNSRASALSRQESDTNPRSFNQEHESDIHFFFG